MSQRKRNLDKTILFNKGEWTTEERLNQVVDLVLNDIRIPLGGGYKRYPKRYRRIMANVILNLFKCHQNPYCEWVAYSRDRNNYKYASRYNKLRISYRPFNAIITALEEKGYVENVTGVYYPKFNKVSRMKPTMKLAKMFYPAIRVKTHLDIELVRLNRKVGDKKVLQEYEDTKETIRMRRSLEVLNSALEKSCISHGLNDDQKVEHMKAIGRPLDYTKTKMYRVFNESFNYGGRFYGGWWIECKREYRRFITIGGSPTVELDYSGLHPSILYDMEGVPVPDWDLYTPKGHAHLRGVCKALFNSLLNAPTKEKAIKGAMQKYNEYRRPPNTLKKMQATQLADMLIEMHAPIKKYLGTGIGRVLQFRDSCVAESIMHSLLDKGIVSLPVHDSFIVAKQYEEDLRSAMMNEYWKEFGSWPKIG